MRFRADYRALPLLEAAYSPEEGGVGPLESTKDKKRQRGGENDERRPPPSPLSRPFPLPERYIESRKWNIERRPA